MRRLLSKRAVLLVCALLLVAFLARPRVGRLRGKVADSIAQALGRHVEISSLHLRIFPRPGFELDDLVVHDDPAFGAEPLLRAPDVTAWLNVSALLHGRIAVSSLSLSEASLNLTRKPQLGWNLQDLIQRTSRTTLAPTGSGTQHARIGFPYIEATRARINFKVGSEKTHFALTNAEFALWQESENTWSMRLKAAPIRTDANLTDTGVINVSGTWNRSADLHQTPMQIAFEWKQAQIGQVSRLVYGSDKEWRGGVTLSGTALGIPDDLRIAVDGRVDGFRRQDILAGAELRLAAHCNAEFNAAAQSVSNLDCVAPSGAGFLELKGGATGPSEGGFPFSTYDLWLVAAKVPAQSALETTRRVSMRVPEDFQLGGEINGSVEVSKEPGQEASLRGNGSLRELQLASSGDESFGIGTVPFSIAAEKSSAVKSTKTPRERNSAKVLSAIPVSKAQVLFGPVNVPLGRTAPVQIRVAASADGYEASAKGDAGVKRLLQVAHTLGLPAPAVAADGSSSVDMKLAGLWHDNKRAILTGNAQLHAVQAQVRGLNAPLEIANATLEIDEKHVRVQNLSASAGTTLWRGSLDIPRPCTSSKECDFRFNLHTNELEASELNRLLNPAATTKSWYRLLSLGSGQPPYLLVAKASGKVAIDKLQLGAVSGSHFSADLSLDAGEVKLANIRSDFLNGHADGDWKANFAERPPEYQGAGTFENVELRQLGEVTHDSWIDGVGNAKYSFSSSGRSLPDLLGAAILKAEFTLSETSFPHIVLTSNSGPLRAANFSGELSLTNGNISFSGAKLESANGVYTVTGTAALSGALNLKLSGESASAFNVTGTLSKTRVTPVPTAEAALKP